MKLCKFLSTKDDVHIGVVEGDNIRIIDIDDNPETGLSRILHGESPRAQVQALLDASTTTVPLAQVALLPPVDRQEIWAAGVTYKRSKEEREKESEGAARFYDLVYTAARPELFLKATPERVVGPGGEVRVRKDSKWNVPEPEVTLVLSPKMEIVGYTIGNDMSSRDIEGENPLYLPQAKIYNGSCSIGPVITLADALPPREEVAIRLTISRTGKVVFEGETSLAAMARSFEDLVSWLGKELAFPQGALLLTGTGIVPKEDFSLASGDAIVIEVSGIGELRNIVA